MKSLYTRISDPLIRNSLHKSVVDAVLWALMFGWSEHYIIPFVLYFKASPFFVSMLIGLNQLGISVFQFVGAAVVRRYPHRKTIAIIGNEIQALTWILILVVAWWTKEMWIVLCLFVIGTSAVNTASPGWFSWMNDIVPPGMKGEFWGKRNRVIGIAQLIATLSAGSTLYFCKSRLHNEWIGFVILIPLAALCRALSFFPIYKTHEPPMISPKARRPGLLRPRLYRFLRSNFGRFIFFAVLTNFSVNILAVLLPIQFLKVLHFNYLIYTVVTLLPAISLQISMSYWGPLTDHLGNYMIMKIGAFGTIFVALLWIFAHNVYAIIVLQIISGFMLAGFNLSCQNFIFESARREHVPSSMAMYNGLINVFAFLGSLTGGLMAQFTPSISFFKFSDMNLEFVFLFSFIVRGAIFIFFAGSFKEVKTITIKDPWRYILVNLPPRTIHIFLRQFRKKN